MRVLLLIQHTVYSCQPDDDITTLLPASTIHKTIAQLRHYRLWRTALVLLPFLWLLGCSDQQEASFENTKKRSPDITGAKPLRIVSLDYCADQYVLKLADKEQILAVSPDATKSYSYMRETAIGVPTIQPRAEDVLIQQPDLVVRSYGGGPNVSAFFNHAGIPVVQIGWTQHLKEGQDNSLQSVLRSVAAGLGQVERGEQVITEFNSRLAAIPMRNDAPETLYMTTSGVTTGTGSLIHEMLSAAGLANFQKEPGWHSLPLERLVYEQPDMVAAAFFESFKRYSDIWSPSRHPVARQQLNNAALVHLQGAWTSCGGWFLMDAIEALAEGGSS